MALSKRFMQVMLQKRNLKKVSMDTNVAYCSVYRLANSENIDEEVFQHKTLDAISEYLYADFDLILKNYIIELKKRGGDDYE
jgi:hypothetical protein